MSRVTRKKAAEIAEQLHVDEDAVLDMNAEDATIKAKLATPEPNSRAPLGEIAPNSAESKVPVQEDEPVQELKKSTRGRKAGKKAGAKGKKNDLAASTATPTEEGDIVPDDNESAPSPASETAAEELSTAEPELQATEVKLQDRSQSPPSAGVRLTRSQLSKKTDAETEPKSLIDGLGQTPEEQEGYFVSNTDTPTIETPAPTVMSETATPPAMEELASPLPNAVPNVIKNLRSETPAKRSTSNKENVQPETEDNGMASPSMYDALEDAVVAAATPPRSEAHLSPAPQDPIAALDDLEDAVDSVNRDIPEVHTSPAKPKVRIEDNTPAVPAEILQKVEEEKPTPKKESKRAAPVVRTTKASQARLSMAQNKEVAGKAPQAGRSRPSTMLGRASSVRQSVAPKAEGTFKRAPSNPTTSASVARSKSLKSSTDGKPREKKETVIPHSKPRPISLSFPTPPPPPKSKKPTTQGTFQLPGEAVAAKLKAAREARMAKDAEEAKEKEKKVAFKARPAPKAAGDVPAVRQTNASRARESIMTGKPAPAPSTSHKRSNTVANTSTTDRPRATLSAKPAATVSSKPRASTSLANISKPRASTGSKPAAPTTATQRVTSSSKGKEVFSRAANAKAAAEKEKADKEAAAKKARAEASERGRVASREWAEKQRLRKLGLKPEGAKKPVGVETKAETATAAMSVEGVDAYVVELAQEETTGAGIEVVAAALAESEEFEAAAA